MSAGLEFALWLLFFIGIAIAAAINEYRERKRKDVIRARPFADSRSSLEAFYRIYPRDQK